MAHPIPQPTVDEAQVRLLENEEAYIERHLAMLAAALDDVDATVEDQLESAAITIIEVLDYFGEGPDWSVTISRGAVEIECKCREDICARVTPAAALVLARKMFDADASYVAELIGEAPYAGRGA